MKKRSFGKMTVRCAALILTAVLLFTSCVSEREKLKKEKRDYLPIEITGYGLHKASNGTITLNGEPFYGFGVNWHGCVSMSTNSKYAEEYWQDLAKMGVPYVRMMFGVFYANEYDEWDKHRDRYLAKMDRVVAYAEKYHIGIVASLMWNYGAIPEHLGEPIDMIYHRESKTGQYIEEYLTTIVERYKDSPAIWMWEIGNEASESANTVQYIGIRNGVKSLENWTYEDLTQYYKLVGDIIFEHDQYRMITGGDMSPRHASNSLRDNGAWYPLDTYEDTLETMSYTNVGHVNCASVHYPDPDTWLDYYMRAAKELNVAFWVGEFHGELFYNLEDRISAEESPEEANEQKTWNDIVSVYLERDVQMFTTWCYARVEQQSGDTTSLEIGAYNGIHQNYYQMERITKVNADFVAEGKNRAAEYWNTATYLFSDYDFGKK